MTPRAKKILRNLLFLLSIPLIIGAFVFANVISKKQVCQGVKINMLNPEVSFITEKDVAAVLKANSIVPNQTLLKDIHVKNVEGELEQNKWIADAVVYNTAKGVMMIEIKQKTPIIRVHQKDSSDYSYYLDEFANPVEWNQNYTPRILVATTPDLGFAKSDLNIKSDLVALANFINKDSFWSAFITQVDITSAHEINLIPAIGSHTIQIGNVYHLEDKMSRLFAFYQQGISNIEWNRFDEIDVRFKGQIVCRNIEGEILSENPYGVKELNVMKENALELKKQAKSNKVEVGVKQSNTAIARINNSAKKILNPKQSVTLKANTDKVIKPLVKPKIAKPKSEQIIKANIVKKEISKENKQKIQVKEIKQPIQQKAKDKSNKTSEANKQKQEPKH